jgi:hypothetical protein
MFISSSGVSGMGTTNPIATLHIQSGATKLFLSNTDFVNGSVGSGMILHTGAQSGNTYSQIYAFQAGNTSYANLVVPGGNVGIGTTSPSEKLHVAGNVYLGTGNQSIRYRTATNWDYYLNATNDDFRIYDSDTTYFLQAVYNGGSTNKYLSLLNTLTVRNNGNVGIGTTSPSNKLYVSATVEDYVAVIENLGTGTAKKGLWIKTDSSFTNSTVLKVTGTTSDSETLQVNPGQVRIGPGSIGQFDGTLFVTSSAATVAPTNFK